MEIRSRAGDSIPEGGVKIVQSGSLFVGVYRIDGELYAIEDRCSHDDGPLCEGDREGFEVICPRHGARFDLRTGDGAVAARDRGRGSVPGGGPRRPDLSCWRDGPTG